MTTQQAANMLNISQQYLVRLLDEGMLPFQRVGIHRMIRMEDLVVYKRKRDQKRMASLDELSELTEEFGGYVELQDGD